MECPGTLHMGRRFRCPHRPHLLTLSCLWIDFEVTFYAAGQRGKWNSKPGEAAKPRLYLISVGTWEPSEEVIQVWRESKEGLLVKRIIKPCHRGFKR